MLFVYSTTPTGIGKYLNISRSLRVRQVTIGPTTSVLR